MKNRFPRQRTHLVPALRRGVTLVEVMIAMGLFAMVASGIAASMVQIRRMSENDIYQTAAHVLAEGIIEQVQRMSFGDLSDTTAMSVPIKFVGVTSSNHAKPQTFDLAWAPDRTTFTQIGARAVPDDPTSAVLGVLLDVEFREANGTTLRPKRYMAMQANITRTINIADGIVTVDLIYKWAVPDRRTSTGGPVYLTREVRTVKSNTPVF